MALTGFLLEIRSLPVMGLFILVASTRSFPPFGVIVAPLPLLRRWLRCASRLLRRPPFLGGVARETQHLAVPARTPSPPKQLRLY